MISRSVQQSRSIRSRLEILRAEAGLPNEAGRPTRKALCHLSPSGRIIVLSPGRASLRNLARRFHCDANKAHPTRQFSHCSPTSLLFIYHHHSYTSPDLATTNHHLPTIDNATSNMTPPVEAGSPLAQAIQNAAQSKLVESGWVAEENDTTLSEYVVMMLVQGKDADGVKQELGGDLLGVGEDDPGVAEFAQWLFQHVQSIAAPQEPAAPVAPETQPIEQQQDASQTADAAMDDVAPPADGTVPSGPKAMRDGTAARGRGRGGRMLGQMNNHMNRDQLPDPLRRIKGAAGGQQGRIDAHAGRDAPRGPRGRGMANGMQRMMNGRGGAQQMNPMMQNPMAFMDPQTQRAFEFFAQSMQQAMTGQMPVQSPGFNVQNARPLSDRVSNKKPGFKARQQQLRSEQGDAASDSGSMDVDSRGPPFDTTCRFNLKCTNPTCHFAHQSPAAPAGITLDMNDTCDFGAACQNNKCVGRHPSPAQRVAHKQEVDCKFAPHCANPQCPYRHPDMPPCRNGADCSVPNCKFSHSKIMCRYTPCTKPNCPFKHNEGQRGVFKDKVWTPGQGTSDRFEGLQGRDGAGEELILPQSADGTNGANGANGEAGADAAQAQNGDGSGEAHGMEMGQEGVVT